MEVYATFDHLFVSELARRESVQLRHGAKSGLWSSSLLPIAFTLSAAYYSDTVTLNYQLSGFCSIIITAHIVLNILKMNCHIFTFEVFCISSMYLTHLRAFTPILLAIFSLSLFTAKSYSLFINLLKRFPNCFSIGEAVIVTQGTVVFIFSALFDQVIQGQTEAYLFSEMALLGVIVTLCGLILQPRLRETLPFYVFILTVFILIMIPLMYHQLNKRNPIVWLLSFCLQSHYRIWLLGYWGICSLIAVYIAWRFSTSKRVVKLTILRKYFHGIIVAIYLPGIFFDPDILFLASTVALAIFLLVEAIRVCDVRPLGSILQFSLRKLVDEKDQGCLILTHVYLLAGCSLPLWIFPVYKVNPFNSILPLCSGIICLGIGDTAASIGGTKWGKRRLFQGKKTVEGLLCSFVAEIAFVTILNMAGLFGPGPFPWIKFLFAAFVTSTVEALTSQVDNLVLPLIMYIMVI